ncbi:MAG: hypothetical protein ACREJO_03485 [Phycisphaerales bacterium]
MRFQRTRAALEVTRKATAEYHEAIKREFRKGLKVSWMHGRHERRGVVVDRDGGERVLVQTSATNKMVWINVWNLLRFDALGRD